MLPSVYTVTLPDSYYNWLSGIELVRFDYSAYIYPGKCLSGPVWMRILLVAVLPLAVIALSVFASVGNRCWKQGRLTAENVKDGLYVSLPISLVRAQDLASTLACPRLRPASPHARVLPSPRRKIGAHSRVRSPHPSRVLSTPRALSALFACAPHSASRRS